jgi:hypothetical protein
MNTLNILIAKVSEAMADEEWERCQKALSQHVLAQAEESFGQTISMDAASWVMLGVETEKEVYFALATEQAAMEELCSWVTDDAG